MLKQSKGIIYVQGKETKDATLIGLAYMDKVELKNKNIMKTIEEVKKYFKNAKEVRCLSDGIIYDLTKIKITKGIHQFNNSYWINAEIRSMNIQLTEGCNLAEIISYKENKPEFEHLEEIEVSDDGINFDYKAIFIGISYEKEYVIQYKKDGINFDYWKYARKINHERNKAIETIQELMKVNDIKTNEL